MEYLNQKINKMESLSKAFWITGSLLFDISSEGSCPDG